MLPDSWTTVLQNDARSGCSSRLECEVFRCEQGVVLAIPPEEYQSPIHDGVWEMTETVHGLEEAPADFDEHFGNVAEDHCDESGFLSLVRLMSEPATFLFKAHKCHDVQTHG